MGATYKLKRKTGANTTEEVLFPIASVDGLQTALNGKLGTSAKAADSAKLNGQAASHYLNYTNLTNKPTIPTATSQLTNDSGFLTTETYKGTVTSVKVGTTSYTPSSGVVSLPAYPTVPTQTSQLTNNSDFATNASVDTKIANLVNSAPEALDTLGELATALQTHEDAYDALLTTVGGKVDKVSGKGLSTNDYTTAEKNKLAGIASGAEVNVQSDWSVTDSTSDAFIKNKPSVVNVNQYYTTTNNNYPLLFKALAGNTSTANQLGATRFANTIYVNPSTGTVYANDFVVGGKSIVGGRVITELGNQGHADAQTTIIQLLTPSTVPAGKYFYTYYNDCGFDAVFVICNKDANGAIRGTQLTSDGQFRKFWTDENGEADNQCLRDLGVELANDLGDSTDMAMTQWGVTEALKQVCPKRLTPSTTHSLTINSTTVGAYFNVFGCVEEADELTIGSNSISLDSGTSYFVTIEGNLFNRANNTNYWNVMATVKQHRGTVAYYSYYITSSSGFNIADTGQVATGAVAYSGILYE